jgi:hypothetical protein
LGEDRGDDGETSDVGKQSLNHPVHLPRISISKTTASRQHILAEDALNDGPKSEEPTSGLLLNFSRQYAVTVVVAKVLISLLRATLKPLETFPLKTYILNIHPCELLPYQTIHRANETTVFMHADLSSTLKLITLKLTTLLIRY